MDEVLLDINHGVNDFSETIEIKPRKYQELEYELPSSKSHLIRILALASLKEGRTRIVSNTSIGRDVLAMKHCLQLLGTEINISSSSKKQELNVKGVGKNGYSKPAKELNCGNSGTAMRVLMTLCSTCNFPIIINGDNSLSIRDNISLKKSLTNAGVSIKETTKSQLPIVIKGPWFDSKESNEIELDVSKSSQPLTSWLISSSLLPKGIELKLVGQRVSNEHYKLTKSMCEEYGAEIIELGNSIYLKKWNVLIPDFLEIPGDSSMASFAILLSKLHNCEINLVNWPNSGDHLGNDILFTRSKDIGMSWISNKLSPKQCGSYSKYDLTDCNDLITPLSVILAISEGGELSGITHTMYKESNRVEKTIQLMSDFGLKADYKDGIMTIKGRQKPIIPTHTIQSYNDHRIFMTAVILLTKLGGKVIGKRLHEIADIDFMNRLGLI